MSSYNEQIEALLEKSENRYASAILAYIATLRSRVILKQIKEYLQQGQIEDVVTYIQALAKPVGSVVSQAVITAGELEVKHLSEKIPNPQVIVVFEPGNYQAAEIIRNRTDTLIRELTNDQRTIVYEAIYQGQLKGHGPAKIAKEIADTAGLTRRQNATVENYRRLLEAGNKEALNRSLRDKRFDNSVRNGNLTPEQIDRMVERYREKFIRYRAMNIATTESGIAVSEAQEQALKQTLKDAGIADSQVVRTWRSSRDDRTRDTHRAMQGQKRAMNEMFVSPSGARLKYPRDASAPASEIIRCRCTLTTEFV